MGIMDPEKIMDNWFKSVSYDKTGDWRKTPETDEDPEDDGQQSDGAGNGTESGGDKPKQLRMFDESDEDKTETTDETGGDQDDESPDESPDESQDGDVRTKLSIDEVKNLWDGSKQTRDKLVEIIAGNHGDHIHFPTDIKWDGLSRHMKLMAVHAMSDLGHEFEHIDKMPKLPKRKGGPKVKPAENGDQGDDDEQA